MEKKRKKQTDKNKEIYNLIVAELKCDPLRKIKNYFALMAIIPLLVLFYLLLGKNFLYEFFLGTNGLIIAITLFISMLGFIAAYKLITDMVNKLIAYFIGNRLAEEEKIKIISGFTHDVKTPLATARANLQNLLEGMAGILNKTQQEITSASLKALDKAANFINQMLELARLKVSLFSFKRELVDFDQLIKDEVAQISALAKKNNQKVSCRTFATDPKVWGDKEKLSRAVMNLLSNAVKYANEGGRIDIALSSDTDTIRLAVINTGCGIPQDKLNQIFAKYERLNPDSKVEGSGLGLSLVNDIINLHKGHITVKSTPNKKTEFDIILPRDLRIRAK